MLYMVKLPDGSIMENKLYRTKAALPLNTTYEYFQLDPISMEVFPLRIRELRSNPEKTRRELELCLAQWKDEGNLRYHTQDYIDHQQAEVRKLIEIFS